ncbi:MAG: transketolase [Acidobacteria bacterium]|nr:MAG: transketolase [Acidobacteriota bacterium]
MEAEFPRWEKAKDIVDQFIDLSLNYRQSGHPGGSRSKVHALLALLLSGVMRWDIRRPDKPFADRFVLIAGHTCPLVYATLAMLNETLRLRYQETGDERYLVKHGERWQLTWEDLLTLRRRGGLPGHAEFAGKTLIFKWNTGPSGHGFPPSVGMALALKRAGAGDVRVFAMEGEGGYTAGAAHESINSAWGLGLDNLFVLLDWNDFGIDARPASSVMHGTPEDWFGSHGWRVYGAEDGSAWPQVGRALLQAVFDPEAGQRPACIWFRTRKGRGYGKYDYASHGSPHKLNSPEFWETKREFQEKYGVRFEGFGEPAPSDPKALAEQARANFALVARVIRDDPDFYRAVADRLVEIGDSVPDRPAGLRIDLSRSPWQDPRLTDYENYPSDMWFPPGSQVPNRKALAKWGSWVNSWAKKEYGRPLFIAMSADLAESTNIAGFGKPFGDMDNYGVYHRTENPEGVLLLQEITEFCNAGMSGAIASVNFSDDPEHEWNGFGAACSTYGSFSYLKYGPMRLFSQLAQDCDFKVGPVIWVAGHSGPETAEDSRTHFGVFAPSVTQLFPEGHVCDLHPWEANEVPVVLAAGLATGIPIIALHLTRPPIQIPDRKAIGMDSHFAAAKGAYLMRDYRPGEPKGGCVIVQGTKSTDNLIKALPEIDRLGLNVKIVVAISPQLFARQPLEYRERILPDADRLDAMAITNRARASMRPWLLSEVGLEYSLSADRDDRWRTGGSVEDVMEEAGLDPGSIIEGISRFVAERERRLARIERALAGARAR